MQSDGTPVIGTMYTCPQLIRALEGSVDEEALTRAADVWAVCVTLYFLLYARWPFEKKEIASWATTPREHWKNDGYVNYPSTPRVPWLCIHCHQSIDQPDGSGTPLAACMASCTCRTDVLRRGIRGEER